MSTVASAGHPASRANRLQLPAAPVPLHRGGALPGMPLLVLPLRLVLLCNSQLR